MVKIRYYKIKNMKSPRMNSLVKNLLMSILAISMIFSFTECSRKILFLNSPVVPAATGYAKVKRDSNKNYVIQITLSNLAEVSRLTPPKQTYIVWILTDRDETKNIGQIKSSNNLNASFETVSSFKPTKLFITAENDPSTQYPGEPVVLTTNRFWND
jgi:hypothetical protein